MSIRCPTAIPDHPFQQVKVRLAEIDAPESGQSFGQKSKEHLSKLCFKEQATVRASGTDRYGRLIARVECRGKDASMEQVRAGLAWAYVKYQTDPAFSVAEQQAREARIGMWAAPGQAAPWVFRSGAGTLN